MLLGQRAVPRLMPSTGKVYTLLICCIYLCLNCSDMQMVGGIQCS